MTRPRPSPVRLLPGLLILAAVVPAAGQVLPPPKDGDVRVVHWEPRDLTDVWLTLEATSPAGEPLPIDLSIHAVFPGRRPATPLSQVEVRAHVGRLWAPRPELTIVLDGRETLDLAGPAPQTLTSWEDGTLLAVVGTVSIDALERIAAARSVTGRALRLDFVLSERQRRAVSEYAARLRSSDPARLPDPIAPLRPVR